MEIKLRYGHGDKTLVIPDRVEVSVLSPASLPVIDDPARALSDALDRPCGAVKLEDRPAPGECGHCRARRDQAHTGRSIAAAPLGAVAPGVPVPGARRCDRGYRRRASSASGRSGDGAARASGGRPGDAAWWFTTP